MPFSRPTPAKFKNYKLRGEWVELRFMTQAAEYGIMVSKPWGDSAPYDLMVEHKGRIRRVQVKSTAYKRDASYKCHVTANGIPYPADHLDFIAAYVIPTDTWYIIPIKAVGTQAHLLLNPNRKTHKYAAYKEAWHLLL
jgi:hypothetical protein